MFQGKDHTRTTFDLQPISKASQVT